MTIVALFIFLIGLCVGSFLNVLIFRLDKKRGAFTGRSECPGCSKQLKWYDLVPVISYLFLEGRCRYCKEKISPIYPVVEIITAFSFLGFYLIQRPESLAFSLFYLLIIASLTALIFFDYLYFIIPDKVIFSLVPVILLFDFLFRRTQFNSLLLSALTLGSVFAIIHLVSHGQWMGFGDAKLMFLIGLVLGYPLGFIAMTLSIWSAALVGIVLMVLGKATRRTPLPFGSFLAGVSIIIIIFQKIVSDIVLILFF